MKLRSALPMRVAKYGSILIALVFCAAGVAIMLLPALPLSAIGAFLGCAMLAFGIVRMIGYFSRDLFRLAFQYDLQFGIRLCVLGIITLIRRQNVAEFICIAYGVCVVAESLFKARTALEARRFGIRQWWLTLALAILSAAAGILVVLWPTTAVHIVKLMLGIALLAEGLLTLSVVVSMVKIIDHQKPDVIETEAYEVWEDN